MRRLRFRRPRPKLIDVDNPDGDLRGSPVELRLAGKNSFLSFNTPSPPKKRKKKNISNFLKIVWFGHHCSNEYKKCPTSIGLNHHPSTHFLQSSRLSRRLIVCSRLLLRPSNWNTGLKTVQRITLDEKSEEKKVSQAEHCWFMLLLFV